MAARTLPRQLHQVNETLAFVLELVALASLAWWGAKACPALAAGIALAIVAPLAAAVAWYSLGQHGLALAFAVIALFNTALAGLDRDAARTRLAD